MFAENTTKRVRRAFGVNPAHKMAIAHIYSKLTPTSTIFVFERKKSHTATLNRIVEHDPYRALIARMLFKNKGTPVLLTDIIDAVVKKGVEKTDAGTIVSNAMRSWSNPNGPVEAGQGPYGATRKLKPTHYIEV